MLKLIFNLIYLTSLSYAWFNYGSKEKTEDNLESEPPKAHKGFEAVTYGSLIKLAHVDTNYRLHSLNAQYGSGSGQQIVTNIDKNDDRESYWLVMNKKITKTSNIGDPVMCNDIIHLKHQSTGSFLHSHGHEAPLSDYQEVSCFNGDDTGDDWQVKCPEDKNPKPENNYWLREEGIQLLHVDTRKYLSSSKKFVFPHPIDGQLEVSASNNKGSSSLWAAREGVFFANNKE